MCGIVGIVGKRKRIFFGSHLDTFEEMLWANAIRGKDSTGAFTVLENNQVKVIKNAGSPEFMLGTKRWDKFRQTAVQTGHILVGHNRKATHGNIVRENAHPFAEDNIVLVHNGTVFNHKDMKDTDVDSHAVCHAIATKGYKEILETLWGSFALVWYDITSKKLNLVRNDQRPLCVTENEDFLFFASEGYMLGWLLNRNNIKFEKLWQLEPMELTTIGFGPYNVEVEKIEKRSMVISAWQGEEWEGKSEFGGVTVTPPSLPGTFPFPKAEEKEVVTFMDTVLDKYSIGDNIIFVPKYMNEDNVIADRYKLRGLGYLPGKPILSNVTWLLPPSVEYDDAVELATEPKLIGKIRSLHRSNKGEVFVYLENIKTDVMLNLWNDTELPSVEWEYLCENFVCARCKGLLDPHQNRITSVLVDGEKVRCICHKCVTKNVGEMPKDKADVIKQASNTAV